MQVSLSKAEKRYEQEKKTNADLKKENLDLMFQVEKLKGTVEGLGEILADTRQQCAKAMMVGQKIVALGSFFRKNVMFIWHNVTKISSLF